MTIVMLDDASREASKQNPVKVFFMDREGSPDRLWRDDCYIVGYKLGANGIPMDMYYKHPGSGSTYEIAGIRNGKFYRYPD